MGVSRITTHQHCRGDLTEHCFILLPSAIMAERAASERPHRTGFVETKGVCIKCLEDDPRNKSLLNKSCLNENEHRQFPKTLVWWRAEKGHLELYDSSMPGKIPKIRPVPFVKYGRIKFALCDPSRCWGHKCRFAHSVEEREIWNGTKFRHNDTPSK